MEQSTSRIAADYAAALASYLPNLESVIHDMCSKMAAMQTRTARALSRVRSESDRLVSTLQRTVLARKTAANALYHQIDTKLLDERAEEAEANARLLDAVATLCARACRGHASLRTDVFSLHVDSLPLSLLSRCTGASDVVMVRSKLAAALFSAWCTAWRDSVDASMSELSGSGLLSFHPGGDVTNTIHITPRVCDGSTASFVTVDDVRVFISCPEQPEQAKPATVCSSMEPSGRFVVTFSISNHVVTSIGVVVTVCDTMLWTGSVPRAAIVGKHVRTLAVAAGDKFGMVVTPDAAYMAISFFSKHKIRVYDIKTGATQVCKFGSHGAGPKQFYYPNKMCLVPTNGRLLVCDSFNNRLQELGPLGRRDPDYIRSLHVPQAHSVAVRGDVVAVGTGESTVRLLSYSSGGCVRILGSFGNRPGEIGYCVQAVRFTEDGTGILVAESTNRRAQMFNVSDGQARYFVGNSMLADGCKDVEIASSGEIMVADSKTHRVLCLNASGDVVVRKWGKQGDTDASFQFPVALALLDHKLFVLDSNRVQVFE